MLRPLPILVALTVLASLPPAAGGQAKGGADPAFARSRVEPAPAAIVANQPFDAGFVVVNDGAATTYSRIVFDLPTDVLLAAPLDGCAGSLDPATRAVVIEGAIATGEVRRCRLSLIAIPDASTHASFSVRVETPPDRFAGDVREASVDTPPRPRPFRIAGIGVGPLEIAVGTWATAFLTAFVASRRRATPGARGARRLADRGGRRGQARLAVVVACGFLALFAGLAWSDWRTLAAYSETSCTIVDSTLTIERVRSATSRRAADATIATPRLALRYTTPGGRITAIDTPMATRLSSAPSEAARLVDAIATRGTIPCWYDPADTRHVAIERGFGGAYLFIVAPLLLLAYGAWLWRAAA